jgi:PKD repeat protein
MKAQQLKSRLVFSMLFVLTFFTVRSQDIYTINQNYTGANAISECFGLIAASGGNTNPVYGNNENYTFTICSDTPGDQVTVTFNLFSLSTIDTAPGNANNSDQMYVYDGIDTNPNNSNFLGNYGGTGLQGVVIQATPQNTTGCLTFQFVSNDQGTGQFTASASCLTPCATPQAGGIILDGITEDSIRVCINEEITFQEQGSEAQMGFDLINYTWDFGDETQESMTNAGGTVTHSYAEPGYYLVQLFVQDDNPDNVCTNTNFISLKVLVATEPIFVGFQESVSLCIGEELNFIATPELYENTYTGDGGLVEVDNGCLTDTQLGVAQNIDINLTEYIDGATITSVDDFEGLCLSMEHSFMGDLVVYITCPTGQQLMLHQQGGGGTQIGVPNPADNINCDDPTTFGEPMTYCFTPVATETWVEWVNAGGGNGTLEEGDYEPIGTFNDLIGCPANGIWTLTVVDNWAADDGQLFSFSLNLGPDLYPDELEFTPEILPGPSTSFWSNAPFSTINDNNFDEITVTPTIAGEFTYEYTVIDDFGCSNDTSFTITVFDALDVAAPADFGIGCNDLVLQGWYEGYPVPQCSQCFEDQTYCYEDNANETWTVCSDNPGNGIPLSLYFESGVMETGFEDLTIYDGPNTSSPIIEAWSGGDATGMEWVANSGCITFTFTSDGSVSCAGGSFNYVEWIFSVQPQAPTEVATWAPDGYEWSWSPVNPLDDPFVQSPTIVNLTGQTTFTVTGYPVGHPDCASSDEVVVYLEQNQNAGDDTEISVCSNAATFDMRDSLAGSPYAMGQWLDALENPFPSGTFNPATDNPGVYYHFIPGGCDTAELVITLVNPMTITTPNDTILCYGSAVNLDLYNLVNGKPPYQYTWTYNTEPVATGEHALYTPDETGEVCLTVQDGCATEVTQCFQTDLLPPIDVAFTADTTATCWPGSFSLSITSDPAIYTFSQWLISNGTSISNDDDVELTFETPGNYNVVLKLTNAAGCSNTSATPLTLSSFAPPVAGYVASPQPTNIMNPEIQFTDMTEGYPIVSYAWTFYNSSGEIVGGSAAANPIFEFSSDYGGDYTVNLEVTDIHNCSDVITPSTVTVDDILQFYIPTAFTPNGDGVNDELFFEGADIDPTRFEFKLFNRFGEVIFETVDPTVPWVGNIDDGQYYAPNGAYNWIATIVSKSTGVKKELNGSVLITR